jgi:DNA ligase-1
MTAVNFADDRFRGVDVYPWIQQLEQRPGRIDKENVIQQALVAAQLGDTSAQAFLFNAHQAYNAFLVFGVRQIPTTSGVTDAANPWPVFWTLLEDLRTRAITGHRARDRIQEVSQLFDSAEWNNVCARVLTKDLRCGISEKTINKIVADTEYAIPVFSCQLAQDSTDHQTKMSGVKRLEVKLDGQRVLAIVDGASVNLYSRNGQPMENFPQIVEAITNCRAELMHSNNTGGRFVLDGEIMGESFQKLMKQARRKRDAKTEGMIYHVFDMIPLDDFERGVCNLTQRQRIDMLERARVTMPADGMIQFVPGMNVDLDSAEGQDVMRRFAEAAVAKGYEGIMIKDLNAPYRCKRTSAWLKWKPTISVDLKIVAVEEGTGKYVGQMGALICQGTDQGRLICTNVGSGFSDAQRMEFWQERHALPGQTVEICADAVTQNQDGGYSVRFPRFLRFRDDK